MLASFLSNGGNLNMKKIAVLITILALSVFMGCTKKTDSSAEDNSIIVYTALENEQVDKYLKSFYSAHPDVKVTVVRDSTGIITAKLLAEGAATPADLVWGTAVSSLLVLDSKDMIEPYKPAGFDRVLPMLKDANNPPKWVGIDAWEAAFVVNKAELAKLGIEKIESYDDLLDPRLAGKVIMSNPASSGTGFLMVSGVLQLFGADKGWKYLDELDKNIAQYTHSGSAPAKRAAAGEFVVGISYGYAGVAQLKKEMPVDVVFPVEGSGWDVEGNALIKKAAVKNAAKLFLDWSLSDEFMNILKEDYAITGVEVEREALEGYSKNPLEQLIENDMYWAAENRDAILKDWSAKYEGKSE
jgi:iron(III) transport system substrate-binding protein